MTILNWFYQIFFVYFLLSIAHNMALLRPLDRLCEVLDNSRWLVQYEKTCQKFSIQYSKKCRRHADWTKENFYQKLFENPQSKD